MPCNEPEHGRTVRDAILDAHRAVGLAEAERGAVLTAARHAGVTLRTIADVIGVAPSTVMRWTMGGEEPAPGQPDLLACPADTVESVALPGELPSSEES